jgi:hypothetical protein
MEKVMIPGPDELVSTFLSAFGGQLVSITTSVTVHHIEDNRTETFPISFEGILLHVDDNYVYLGQTINQITSAVEKTKIVHIQVKEELTIVDQIFSNMPDPKNEEIN